MRTLPIVTPAGTSIRASIRKSCDPVTGASYDVASSDTMFTPVAESARATARTWQQTATYYTMITSAGRGSIRSLPHFRDPLVRYALTKKGVAQDMVLLYPQPTIDCEIIDKIAFHHPALAVGRDQQVLLDQRIEILQPALTVSHRQFAVSHFQHAGGQLFA